MSNKGHLQASGLEAIRLLRARQLRNRAFIHPSIISDILAMRPDWAGKLNDLLRDF